MQKSADSQLDALLESLRQGKHKVLIDGKAFSPSETEYWVHFEINVDTSVPHVDYPSWIRCK
jgi:hypothetical protein